MARIAFAIYFLFCCALFATAQNINAYSVANAHADSTRIVRDSVKIKERELYNKIIAGHPYFNFIQKGAPPPYTRKIAEPGKEIYFYTAMVLFLLFAVFKASFDKYFADMMNLFFRRSLKQRQLKKQVVQNSLPSLLFNIFFVLVAGFYVAISIQKAIPEPPLPFWQLSLYAVAAIGLIYLGKYFILKFIGWVFKIEKVSDNYIFLIFLVNKILAILLLPLVTIVAITDNQASTIAWTLSWILISGLMLFRLISAIQLVRKDRGISFFHFLLYAFAFEVLPTIVIYKGILSFLK